MRHALQIVPVLVALMVVCTAFVPVASAGGQSRLEQDMLQMANITVNSLDTQLIDYWKVDDRLFFEGFVNFDAESNIEGTVKKFVADQGYMGMSVMTARTISSRSARIIARQSMLERFWRTPTQLHMGLTRQLS